jgi:uncharacterized protein (TIGR03437 family)
MQGFEASAYIQDSDIVYEVHPYYTKDLTDADRDAHFGFLASQFPILAGEWGLTLDDSANCRAVPNDPERAQAVLAQTLDYFESRKISWTISTFLPGNLYIDFSDYYRTDLYQSWTCGAPIPPGLGIGEPIDYYLLGIKEGDLVPVSSGSGNIMTVARGGIVAMYGDRMAELTETSDSIPPPSQMGGISVWITDASGSERFALLRYLSPYLVNLVVPPDTATGLAIFTIVGGSGEGLSGHVLVDDVSPGLYTANLNGRGPVIGTASSGLLWQCDQTGCTALPVPDTTVVVSVVATGIRNANHVTATIAGIPVPVLCAGVQNESLGVDQIDLQLVPELRGAGETDPIVVVDGVPSNAVRIDIQ